MRYRIRKVKFFFRDPEVRDMAEKLLNKNSLSFFIRSYIEGKQSLPEKLRTNNVKVVLLYPVKGILTEEEQKREEEVREALENKFYIDNLFLLDSSLSLDEWEKSRVFLMFLYFYMKLKLLNTEEFFSPEFIEEIRELDKKPPVEALRYLADIFKDDMKDLAGLCLKFSQTKKEEGVDVENTEVEKDTEKEQVKQVEEVEVEADADAEDVEVEAEIEEKQEGPREEELKEARQEKEETTEKQKEEPDPFSVFEKYLTGERREK